MYTIFISSFIALLAVRFIIVYFTPNVIPLWTVIQPIMGLYWMYTDYNGYNLMEAIAGNFLAFIAVGFVMTMLVMVIKPQWMRNL